MTRTGGMKAVKARHSPVLYVYIRVVSICSHLVDDLKVLICAGAELSPRGRWLQTKQSTFAVCNSTNSRPISHEQLPSTIAHSPSPLPRNETSTEVSHRRVSLADMWRRNGILNLWKSMKRNRSFCETHLLHPVTHYNTFNTLICSCRQLRCEDNNDSSSAS